MRKNELRRSLLITVVSMLMIACMTVAAFASDYSEVYAKYFGNADVVAGSFRDLLAGVMHIIIR